ncbi:NAD(P)H-binding protein [Aeromicrobium sp.]|uniref:NAD(P)-dependent oxidoreductase n=1 Tax=Aeromicrobium sp. TaxID=1871063 RepID=UPI00199769D9|nr:NAD(P)H-binding protein [Aeromicrobium sp.]
MRIAVIGATGMAGFRIAAEAARRGHSLSGISRSNRSNALTVAGLTLSTADATDPEAMGRIATEHDVIVLATRPAPGTKGDVSSPVTTVLDAALDSGRRVIVIGGAGPLRSPDRSDRLVIDDDRFVPHQWRTIGRGIQLTRARLWIRSPAGRPFQTRNPPGDVRTVVGASRRRPARGRRSPNETPWRAGTSAAAYAST